MSKLTSLIVSLILIALASFVNALDEYTFLYDGSFDKASSDGATITTGRLTQIIVPPGNITRIRVVVPPGAKLYNVGMEAKSWERDGFSYEHSFSADESTYTYEGASAAYPANFIAPTSEQSETITTTPLTDAQYGYIVFKNQDAVSFTLTRLSTLMVIDNAETYNNWRISAGLTDEDDIVCTIDGGVTECPETAIKINPSSLVAKGTNYYPQSSIPTSTTGTGSSTATTTEVNTSCAFGVCNSPSTSTSTPSTSTGSTSTSTQCPAGEVFSEAFGCEPVSNPSGTPTATPTPTPTPTPETSDASLDEIEEAIEQGKAIKEEEFNTKRTAVVEEDSHNIYTMLSNNGFNLLKEQITAVNDHSYSAMFVYEAVQYNVLIHKNDISTDAVLTMEKYQSSLLDIHYLAIKSKVNSIYCEMQQAYPYPVNASDLTTVVNANESVTSFSISNNGIIKVSFDNQNYQGIMDSMIVQAEQAAEIGSVLIEVIGEENGLLNIDLTYSNQIKQRIYLENTSNAVLNLTPSSANCMQ